MPKVFDWNGYRFFFFSNEGNPLEPIHVHVRKAEAIAKIWLETNIAVAYSYSMSSRDLRRLQEVSVDNEDLIKETWNEFFNT